MVINNDVYPFYGRRKGWRWWPPLPVLPPESEGFLLYVEELTDATPDFVLLLSVTEGEPFDISDHHPIYAGEDANGNEEYLAVAASPVGDESVPICIVSDGDTTAQFWDSSGREYRVTEFRVFVLAFSPEEYLLDADGGENIDTIHNIDDDDDDDDDDDRDSTGPVRWIHWGEVLHLPGKPLLLGEDEYATL